MALITVVLNIVTAEVITSYAHCEILVILSAYVSSYLNKPLLRVCGLFEHLKIQHYTKDEILHPTLYDDSIILGGCRR